MSWPPRVVDIPVIVLAVFRAVTVPESVSAEDGEVLQHLARGRRVLVGWSIMYVCMHVCTVCMGCIAFG
jgi:hypothetical protein